MLCPDFKAALLQAPSGRSLDPHWLDGAASGRIAFLLGGAGGLLESPGLAAAGGQVVVGTNWTLRALVPSIWLVVDKDVWRSESPNLAGCPDTMAVVASKGIFGGGAFSTTHNRRLRLVGRREWPVAQVSIQRAPASWRQNGKSAVHAMDPFLPTGSAKEWSNGGNSLTYAIQLAHLMGCGQMFAVGFTLASGSSYFFARQNPATRKPSRYQEEIPMAWCSWFEKRFPGRVLLDPTFDGPIYSVFRKATSDAFQAAAGH